MASISPDVRGFLRIRFIDKRGDERCIRVGKQPRQWVEDFAVKVAELNSHQASGTALSLKTTHWLAGLGVKWYDKLAAVGLVARRGDGKPREVARVVRLRRFINDYIASRTDAKTSTRQKWSQTRARLVEFFGADKPVKDVTPADADRYFVFLNSTAPKRGGTETGEDGKKLLRLSPATIGKDVKIVRMFFDWGIRAGAVRFDPFDHLKAPGQVNKSRDYFVERQVAQQIIDACPDEEWQLIFALARYGGLWCPSEIRGLLWAKVDWNKNRFQVYKPKNARHKDRGRRWCPIFPELRPYLDRAWRASSPDAIHVISKHRLSGASYRKQLLAIAKTAGLTKLRREAPWPNLWKNLRSSRITEALDEFPAHLCNAFFGHSELIARAHYRQVRDQDFERAGRPSTTASDPVSDPGGKTERSGCTVPQETPITPAPCPISASDQWPRWDSLPSPETPVFSEESQPGRSVSVTVSDLPESLISELRNLTPDELEAMLRAGLQFREAMKGSPAHP